MRVAGVRGALEADFEVESYEKIESVPFEGCAVTDEGDGIYRIHAGRRART